MPIHTGARPFGCDVCGKHFAEANLLKKHEGIHKAKKMFQSSFFNKILSCGKKEESNLPDEEMDKCKICQKEISVRVLNGERYCFCDSCLEKIALSGRLSSDGKYFRCRFCEQDFMRRHQLQVHLRTHTGEKPFQCEICRKSFTQRVTLQLHMNTHTGEKAFLCEVCGKSFTYSNYLKIHMRIHTGEKPYSCKICGKRFSQNSYLPVHLKTHDKEKQTGIKSSEIPLDNSYLSFYMRAQENQMSEMIHLENDFLPVYMNTFDKDKQCKEKISEKLD